MAWLWVICALFFGYISVSMFYEGFRESDPQQHNKLMRSGFGTLVLSMMAIVFAWYSFNPPPPPGA